MPVTGKTGADAIFKHVLGVVRLLVKYSAKFQQVIDQAQAAGAITATDAATIRTFVSIATDLLSALDKLATYSSF